jgi:hypothetical protein
MPPPIVPILSKFASLMVLAAWVMDFDFYFFAGGLEWIETEKFNS